MAKFHVPYAKRTLAGKKSTPPPVVAVVTNVSYMSKDLSRRCENYAPTTQTLVVNSSSTAIQGFSIILSNSSFASPLLDSYDTICVQFSPTGASTPSSTSIGPGGYISRQFSIFESISKLSAVDTIGRSLRSRFLRRPEILAVGRALCRDLLRHRRHGQERAGPGQHGGDRCLVSTVKRIVIVYRGLLGYL